MLGMVRKSAPHSRLMQNQPVVIALERKNENRFYLRTAVIECDVVTTGMPAKISF